MAPLVVLSGKRAASAKCTILFSIVIGFVIKVESCLKGPWWFAKNNGAVKTRFMSLFELMEFLKAIVLSDVKRREPLLGKSEPHFRQ